VFRPVVVHLHGQFGAGFDGNRIPGTPHSIVRILAFQTGLLGLESSIKITFKFIDKRFPTHGPSGSFMFSEAIYFMFPDII
jgi:hypothetical protein